MCHLPVKPHPRVSLWFLHLPFSCDFLPIYISQRYRSTMRAKDQRWEEPSEGYSDSIHRGRNFFDAIMATAWIFVIGWERRVCEMEWQGTEYSKNKRRNWARRKENRDTKHWIGRGIESELMMKVKVGILEVWKVDQT